MTPTMIAQPKWRLLRIALIAVVASATLFYAIIRLTLLDTDFLKGKVSAGISATLQRDETQIGQLSVGWWPSSARLNAVQIPERYDWRDRSQRFIQCSEAVVSFPLWPLIRSRFKNPGHVKITLTDPIVFLARDPIDGQWNFQDVLDRCSLKKNNASADDCTFEIQIKDGIVHVLDGKGQSTLLGTFQGTITTGSNPKTPWRYELSGMVSNAARKISGEFPDLHSALIALTNGVTHPE